MTFDTAIKSEAEEAANFLGDLCGLHKKVDINVHKAKRSNPQNRGLHLLLGHLSNETGYSLDEAKQLYKEMNPGIYKYTKATINGESVREFWRSSAELTKDEMQKTIDRLYIVCGENGIELPLLTNEAEMRSIERAMEANGRYN